MTIRSKTADNRLGGITLNISGRGERRPLLVLAYPSPPEIGEDITITGADCQAPKVRTRPNDVAPSRDNETCRHREDHRSPARRMFLVREKRGSGGEGLCLLSKRVWGRVACRPRRPSGPQVRRAFRRAARSVACGAAAPCMRIGPLLNGCLGFRAGKSGTWDLADGRDFVKNANG